MRKNTQSAKEAKLHAKPEQAKTAFSKKGQIWVSAVLYILITTVVLVIVIQLGTPLLENLKDKTIFSKTKDNFLAIDKQIKDISSEGYGSQRIIPLEIQKGKVDITEDGIKWQMQTDADIIEPGSSIALGDLTISANSDVSAKKKGDSIILENSAISVNFSSYGNKTDWYNDTILTENGMINYMEYKTKSGKIKHTGEFTFDVKNNGVGLSEGNGYTMIEKEGDFLTEGKLIYHINSTVEYDLIFTLGSRADFIKVDIVNRKD